MRARWVFHLPYYLAEVESKWRGEFVKHRSIRRKGSAELIARYRAIGNAAKTQAGSLDYFLTERDRLFSTDRRGKIWTARIRHEPWSLQGGEAEIVGNSGAAGVGIKDAKIST